MDLDRMLAALDGVRQVKPDQWEVRCPCHDDTNASLTITQAPDRLLWHCHAGCTQEDVGRELRRLSGEDATPRPRPATKTRKRKPSAPVVAEYVYEDADGQPVLRVSRRADKSFYQSRWDGRQWRFGLNGTDPVLYHLPEIADPERADELVFLLEGEKDCDRLRGLGVLATTNPGGCNGWRADLAGVLEGRDVVVVGDADQPGRERAERIRQDLDGVAASVRVLELPGDYDRDSGYDISDWLDDGHSPGELLEAVATAKVFEPPKPITLAEILAYQQKHYYLPDTRHALAVFASVVANRLPGNPVWLLIVGPPSGGKTEALQPIYKLPGVHVTGTITEAGLLSGSPKRDRAADATGGLLRQVGEEGIVCCKDFGSVLELRRETRASTLAALREVYDGRWTRHVGTDGGRVLEWSGKCGLIAGVTSVIDRAHGVMSMLGERFALYRLPAADRQTKAMAALKGREQSGEVRATLADMTERFFRSLDYKRPARDFTDEEERRIVVLADICTRARSGVARDSYKGEIIDLPEAEDTPRLAILLAQMMDAFDVLGTDRDLAWTIVTKLATDSIPNIRRAAIEVLLDAPGPVPTNQIATDADAPTMTMRRALEDLQCHGVVLRYVNGNAHTWELKPSFAGAYPRPGEAVPEMFGGYAPTDMHGALNNPTHIGNISGTSPTSTDAMG